jgi:hypothetical protein
MHRLAQHIGLVAAIDRHVQVLKVHLPYHESDHVMGIAYNMLCGGTCLQDIELRRQNEGYLDALGAQRIPDPTTAGDFCRRFDEPAIEALQTAINETRVRVWRTQPAAFFDEAAIDADGTLAETTGQCKEGMDIADNGVWDYQGPGRHPGRMSLTSAVDECILSASYTGPGSFRLRSHIRLRHPRCFFGTRTSVEKNRSKHRTQCDQTHTAQLEGDR